MGFLEENKVDKETMSALDTESKGVLVEMMNMDDLTKTCQRASTTLAPPGDDVMMVQNLPVKEAVIASWDLDMLNMDSDGRQRVVLHLVFDTSVGKSTGRM